MFLILNCVSCIFQAVGRLSQSTGLCTTSLDSLGNSVNDSHSSGNEGSPNHSPHSVTTLRSCSLQKYPKTFEELSECLENANNIVAANIPMLVIEDYMPAEDWTGKDEVAIQKGMVVNAMYKTYDWVFVQTPEEVSGFIPYQHIEPIGIKKSKEAKDFSQQFPEQAPPIPSRLCRPQRDCDTLRSSTSSQLYMPSEESYRDSMRSIAGSVIFHRGNSVISNPFSTLSNRDSGLSTSRFSYRSSGFSNKDSMFSTRDSGFSQRESITSNHGGSLDSHQDSATSLLGSLPSIDSMEVELPRRLLHGKDQFSDITPARNISPEIVSPDMSFVSISSTSMTIDISDSSSFFTKHDTDRLTVLFDYDAQDENDVTIRSNDMVTLLNDEDPDWLWVRCDDGAEGFIPRTYAINLEALHLDPNVKTTYL